MNAPLFYILVFRMLEKIIYETTAILKHFVSLKKVCYWEENKWCNLLNLKVSSNGFVVNNPKEITMPLRQFDWTRSYQNASLCSAHSAQCTFAQMHCAMIIYARWRVYSQSSAHQRRQSQIKCTWLSHLAQL